MTIVEALVQVAIALLQQILASILGIASRQTTQAQERDPYVIEDNTVLILGTLDDGTNGLTAINDNINTLRALLSTDVTAILTAIGAPQQASVPVTLPTSPPGGGTWLDTSNIVDLVWNSGITGYAQAGATMVLQAAQAGVLAGGYADNPFVFGGFRVGTVNFPGATLAFTISYPQFDPSDILSTEDALACLVRQNVTWACSYGEPPSTFVTLTPTDGTKVSWVTLFDEVGFLAYKDQLYPAAGINTPPVWPGLANAVLGSPVAIATTLTVSTPMDGVLVAITGVPSKQGQFNFGGTVSWRNIGALAFTDDNGDEEFPQTLGFEQAVYCPKAMAHASGLVLRASAGVTGTVTPWTLA